jgi:hypothetical protein
MQRRLPTPAVPEDVRSSLALCGRHVDPLMMRFITQSFQGIRMSMLTPLLFSATLALLLAGTSSAATPSAAGDVRYFGLDIPRARPEPFQPYIFESLGALTPTNPAYSPDFRRFAFTTVDQRMPGKPVLAIYETRFDGGRWSEPQPVNLDGDAFNTAEPAFSPDGQWLYYTSNRPADVSWSVKVFRARVATNGYHGIELARMPFVARAGMYYPQPRIDGSLMFTSSESCEGCSDDLYAADALPNGAFAAPTRFGGDFNSKRDDWDLTEHPDGRLRLWASARDGGVGRVDIYFSRRDERAGWSPAQNLSAVNSPAIETAPRLTPDGELLFFQRVENGREILYWVQLSSVLPSG